MECSAVELPHVIEEIWSPNGDLLEASVNFILNDAEPAINDTTHSPANNNTLELTLIFIKKKKLPCFSFFLGV